MIGKGKRYEGLRHGRPPSSSDWQKGKGHPDRESVCMFPRRQVLQL